MFIIDKYFVLTACFDTLLRYCMLSGQVSLQIEVKALKLIQETYDRPPEDVLGKMVRSTTYTFSREWISLEDIKMKIAELLNPRPSIQYEMVDTSMEEDPKKRNSCLCACFSRLFSRRKGNEATQVNGRPGDKYLMKHTANGYRTDVQKLNNHQVAAQLNNSKNDLENLRNMADAFCKKADILYAVLRDPKSPSFTQLVKYFEQDRGVLVLETNCDEGFVIVNICMKMDQLEHLRRDYNNGKLNKDIENCVITDDVLLRIGAKGIKLNCDINQDDFDLAEQELN